jgi:hypothetical protein
MSELLRKMASEHLRGARDGIRDSLNRSQSSRRNPKDSKKARQNYRCGFVAKVAERARQSCPSHRSIEPNCALHC